MKAIHSRENNPYFIEENKQDKKAVVKFGQSLKRKR